VAKVNAPLFSFKAFGSVGKGITYTASKGINIVKRFFKSKDNLTSRRLQIRETYQEGILAWKDLTPEQKQGYEEQASGKTLTGYNLFMQEFLNENIPAYIYGLYGNTSYGKCVYKSP